MELGEGESMQERSFSFEETKYQLPGAYLDNPNPVEAAELERASFNMLFFSASSTLFRLSFISLRRVWTCLLIACHTSFEPIPSDVENSEASGLTGFALCVRTIDSRAVTKAS